MTDLDDLNKSRALWLSREASVLLDNPETLYCSICFQTTQREGGSNLSACHSSLILTRASALVWIRNEIWRLNKAIRNKMNPVIPESTPEHHPRQQKVSGPITLEFPDPGYNRVFAEAHLARKWLRDRGLSVTQAVKDGSFWKFTQNPSGTYND